MSVNTMPLRADEAIGFNVSVWFLLSLGLLMFKSGGLAVYAVLGALIHEIGHIIIIFAVGAGLKYVSFDLSGFRLGLRGTPPRGKLMLILLSGCAANLLAVAGFRAFGGGNSVRAFLFTGGNLLLCVLNLLPHSSLDGGKVLRLILGDRKNSEKLLFAADVATLFILILLGGVIFMRGGKNPTALLLALCLVAKLPVFGKKRG